MKRIVVLTLCAAVCAAFGQDPGNGAGGPGPSGEQGGNRPPPPPLPPVIRALDTNHDGIIDAEEIANAPQSLRTLLKSGMDQLTIPDLLGPPHHGRHPHGPGLGGPGAPGTSGTSSTTGTSGGGRNNQDGPPGPPPGPPPGGPGGHRPLPPVIQALDTNHDGIIDAKEIANAAQSLKTLLKNGSDQLTIPDLLGPPPHGRRPHGQGNNQDGPPPDDQNGPPPPDPEQSGSNGQTNAQPPPPPQ